MRFYHCEQDILKRMKRETHSPVDVHHHITSRDGQELQEDSCENAIANFANNASDISTYVSQREIYRRISSLCFYVLCIDKFSKIMNPEPQTDVRA